MSSKRSRAERDDPDDDYQDSTNRKPKPRKRTRKDKQDTSTGGHSSATINADDHDDETVISTTTKTQTAPSRQGSENKKTRKPNTRNKAQILIRLGDVENQNKQLEIQLAAQQKKLDAWHERALAAIDAGKPYHQDDRKISENLNSLSTMISDWATDWCYEDCSQDHNSVEDIEYWMNKLEETLFEGTTLSARARKKLSWYLSGCQYAGEFILTAAIFRTYLLRPLHFSKSLTRNVKFLESRMRASVDQHMFHSRLLRSLYTPEQYSGSITASIIDDPFAHDRAEANQTRIIRLLESPDSGLSELLQPCGHAQLQRRREDLRSILLAAGKLSLQLWVQDCSIEFRHQPYMDEDIVTGIRDGQVLSRTNIKMNKTGTPPDKVKADWWLRPEVYMTRYEALVPQGNRVVVCNPMFLSMDAEQREVEEREHGIVSQNEQGPPTIHSGEKVGRDTIVAEADQATHDQHATEASPETVTEVEAEDPFFGQPNFEVIAGSSSKSIQTNFASAQCQEHGFERSRSEERDLLADIGEDKCTTNMQHKSDTVIGQQSNDSAEKSLLPKRSTSPSERSVSETARHQSVNIGRATHSYGKEEDQDAKEKVEDRAETEMSKREREHVGTGQPRSEPKQSPGLVCDASEQAALNSRHPETIDLTSEQTSCLDPESLTPEERKMHEQMRESTNE